MPDQPAEIKPKALAGGIEVWCAFDQLVPIEELRPNPRNSNKHPDGQIDLLAKAIKYFGWRHTILVSKRSGLIVAGHGRLLAAQKLGLPLVPVDYQDFASDADEMGWLWKQEAGDETSESIKCRPLLSAGYAPCQTPRRVRGLAATRPCSARGNSSSGIRD